MTMQLAFPEATIEDAFWRFHRRHPEVYDELVRLSRSLTARGYRHLGIKMLWETMRYFRALEGLPDEGDVYKLNNNFTSRYARLLMDEPDLAGVFELRELRA